MLVWSQSQATASLLAGVGLARISAAVVLVGAIASVYHANRDRRLISLLRKTQKRQFSPIDSGVIEVA
jgi:uncharacterized membrane protein YhfC